MKRAIGLVVIGLFLFTSLAYAGQETIKDDNDGNKGDIFVNTGTQQGNNDIGHWTDITTIPELKGEKGDTGIGIAGTNGLDGYTPIKGINYFDGINGLNGLNGMNGKDVDPKEVKRLDNRINDHENKINNLNDRVGKLERTQIKAQVEFRVLDTKKLSISPYLSQNFTRNKVDEVGVRIQVKLGRSYEEKLIENTNKRVVEIEKRMSIAPVIERVVDQKGNIKSIRITENGLAVNGKF